MKGKYLGVCVLALGMCLFGDSVASNQNNGQEAAAKAQSSANGQNSEKGQFCITNENAVPREKMGWCTDSHGNKFDIIGTDFRANTCAFSAVWQGEESFISGIDSMKKMLDIISNNLHHPLIRSLILSDILFMKQDVLNIREYNEINEKLKTFGRELYNLLGFIPTSKICDLLIGKKVVKDGLDEYKTVLSTCSAEELLDRLYNELDSSNLTKESRAYFEKKLSSIKELVPDLSPKNKGGLIRYLNTKVLREAQIIKEGGSEENNITDEHIQNYLKSLGKWNYVFGGIALDTNGGMLIAMAYLQGYRLTAFANIGGRGVDTALETTASRIRDSLDFSNVQLKSFGLLAACKKNPSILDGLNYTDYGFSNLDDFLAMCASFSEYAIKNKGGFDFEKGLEFMKKHISQRVPSKRCQTLEKCGLTMNNVLKIQYNYDTNPENASGFEDYGIDMETLKKNGFDENRLRTLCFSFTEELRMKGCDWMTYIKYVMDGGKENAKLNEYYKRYLFSQEGGEELRKPMHKLFQMYSKYTHYVKQNPLSDDEINQEINAHLQGLSDIYILYNGINHFMKLIPSAQNQNGQAQKQDAQTQDQGDQTQDQDNQTQSQNVQ